MNGDLYVDTPAALTALCDRLRGVEWLALDTEFIREKTFYPQLCLLQVASHDTVACVDPLALPDLTPLLDIIYDPAIVKVLHAAVQDLEILYNLRGALPSPMFDTQIAATLLGSGEQVGYASLVKALLDVDLDKSQTRTDWSRRPLDAAQISYAADDVRYLRKVYQQQREELRRGGRLGWLDEDFAQLGDPDRYRLRPEQAWLRLKPGRHCNGRQLAVLRALAAWREREAANADRPRRWVLGDNLLIDMALLLPENLEQMQKLRGLEPSLLKRYGALWLELINEARALPPEAWPVLPPRQQLSLEQDALVDALVAVVRLRGLAHAVSPATLAGRKDLERLVLGERDVSLLHGWRAAVAGHDVLALLEGRLALRVSDGTLTTVPLP